MQGLRITSIAVFALVTITTAAQSQAAVRFAPSGRGTSTIEVMRAEGDTSAARVIRLDYGQPSLRGRVVHGDSLVPFGTIWRTGANATTTMSTDLALRMGDVRLPRGSYALFTLPSRDGWKLVVQRDSGQAAGDYDAKNDLARIDMQVHALHSPVETLSMWLIPSTVAGALGGEFRIAWGTTELRVPFTADP